MHIKEFKKQQIGPSWITWGITIFVIVLAIQTASGLNPHRFKLNKATPNKFDDYASIEKDELPPPPPRDSGRSKPAKAQREEPPVEEPPKKSKKPKPIVAPPPPPPPPPPPAQPTRHNPFPAERDYSRDDRPVRRNSGERYQIVERTNMQPLDTDVVSVGGSDEVDVRNISPDDSPAPASPSYSPPPPPPRYNPPPPPRQREESGERYIPIKKVTPKPKKAPKPKRRRGGSEENDDVMDEEKEETVPQDVGRHKPLIPAYTPKKVQDPRQYEEGRQYGDERAGSYEMIREEVVRQDVGRPRPRLGRK